jgi:hypothetical protein
MPTPGPAPAPSAPADARQYPLYFAEGEIGMYWRLPGNGLTLAGGRIGWTAEGIARDFALDQIRSIRLQHAAAGRAAIGICQIRMRDGVIVNVYAGADQGTPDETQAAHYAAFVRDLHARIPGEAARHIVFHAGLSGTRHAVLTVAVALAALLFVATPLVLLFVVPSWEVLGLLGGGAGLTFPLWRLWDNNRPRRYSPRALPRELVG